SPCPSRSFLAASRSGYPSASDYSRLQSVNTIDRAQSAISARTSTVELSPLRTSKYVTKTGKAFLATLCGLLGMLISSQPCLAEDLHPADIWTDTKLYFTAPLRWDTTDWLYFGGAVAAVAAAHQYDGNVRRHFVTGGSSGLNGGKDPNSLRDAAPAA